MDNKLKFIIIAVCEAIAVAMAAVSSGKLGSVDSDEMNIICLVEKLCSFAKGCNTAFSFGIITACLCGVCFIGLILCIFIDKVFSIMKLAVKVVNGLCFLLMLLSCIIVPVLYEKAYGYSFFKGKNEARDAFWAGAFISMFFCLGTVVCWFGLKPSK